MLKKPELLKDKVSYQVMGTNKWKHVSRLEKMSNKTLKFYLNNNFILDKKKPKKNLFVKQTIDFKDRKNENNYYTPSIIFDTLNVSNGLVFMTKEFEKEFSINGSFTGNLYATINKKDMDISMALYELMPNGKYFFLTRYVGRASYAKDNSKRQLLKPNEKELITFTNTRLISKKNKQRE